MMARGWCWLVLYLGPKGPTPFRRPKEPPFRAVQYGPSGPSFTKGMRSLSAAEALAVKRSVGIQGRSRWQSAEMRVYLMDGSSPSRGDLVGDPVQPEVCQRGARGIAGGAMAACHLAVARPRALELLARQRHARGGAGAGERLE